MTPWTPTGLVVAVGVLVAASVVGLLWQRRRGRLTGVRGTESVPGAAASSHPAAAVARYAGPGAEVTLVQLSSQHCAPCVRMRALCSDLAVDGVRHVEVDVETDPAAVRDLGVWRVPTLFVVDAAGRPAWRAVGVPDRAELTRAVERARLAADDRSGPPREAPRARPADDRSGPPREAPRARPVERAT